MVSFTAHWFLSAFAGRQLDQPGCGGVTEHSAVMQSGRLGVSEGDQERPEATDLRQGGESRKGCGLEK